MKTKAAAFYSQKNDCIMFGIKVYAHGRWYNLAEGGKPVRFASENAMEKKRAELRRQPELIISSDAA